MDLKVFMSAWPYHTHDTLGKIWIIFCILSFLGGGMHSTSYALFVANNNFLQKKKKKHVSVNYIVYKIIN